MEIDYEELQTNRQESNISIEIGKHNINEEIRYKHDRARQEDPNANFIRIWLPQKNVQPYDSA